jgi:MFS family permease
MQHKPDSDSPSVSGEGLAAALPDAAVSEQEAIVNASGAPPAAKLNPEAVAQPNNLWRVGTLVYTSGGIVVLFFWLLWGDFAWNMRERSVGPMVQLFLKSLHASDFTLAMLMTFLPPGINLILSPIISYKSDRLRSRWGRRIPFLLIPTPIAALAMIGIAFSPHIGRWVVDLTGAQIPPNRATLMVFCVLWTIFEVAALVSGAVLIALINDVVPRGRLGRFHGLFRQVSLLDGMIFNYFLLKWAEAHFTLMFMAIALVFGVGFTMMCFNVKEGEYPPPEVDPKDHRAGGFFAAVRIYFRECFSHPYYRWCFAALTLGAVAFLPVNTFSIPYAKQLKMDMDFYGKLVAGSYLTSLVLAYWLGWLVDKFHALRMGMLAMALYAVSAVWAITTINSPKTFGVALVAHVVLSGTYFTTTASLAQALLPRSKFAQFFSAGMIITSLTTMALGPSLGFILDHTNSNYRLTFVAALVISLSTLCVMLVVYHKTKQYGGTKNYVAPGEELR